MRILAIAIIVLIAGQASAQFVNINDNKFKQLKEEMATPNVYRTAGGAPGHAYYQNTADYTMDIEINDDQQKLTGEETIVYTNYSPDKLEYLWLQLDQNVRAKDSDSKLIQTGKVGEQMSMNALSKLHSDFDGGFKITEVTNSKGAEMDYTINKTMMRIDLPSPLAPKGTYTIKIKWWYNINDRMAIGGRAGYEYFEKEDNYLYTIAQFFPRMCVYNDVEGWQNKQFLGRGEFTLPFGDYKVNITVPGDHIVGSTGELQNASKVLSSEQQARWKKALKSYDEPVMIVNPEEALANEKSRVKSRKTWTYFAKNVRDFGFASSRKFIWDAQAVELPTKTVMAMSYYPKEGNPLWERYSTKVVAHTIKVYSKYTFDYPYPVAISVHAKSIGMEYPMICFNGGRPEDDGTYAERTKYGMIGVIIHEVGHNFFPMIINSDERQWTWMDEGLNTFLQYLTEQEWERDYPSRRGPAYLIVDYMKGDKAMISPIMTNSESIHQFGNNAYGKPATAMNILRETIMGRDLFDHAFKTYAERWKFKHPTPEDLFRTMEDASGVDLDWFWRGWFYTTDHCDLSMDDIKWFKIDTKDPDKEPTEKKAIRDDHRAFIGDIRNKESIKETVNERDSKIDDFYTTFDPLDATAQDQKAYERYKKKLTPEEIKLINSNYNYYEISFSNKGGLVMPIILEFTFADNTKEIVRIPAEIWKTNNEKVSKVFFFEKEVAGVYLDPFKEIADTDVSNNGFPRKPILSKFQVFKDRQLRWGADGRQNPMQKAKKEKEKK
ncbi:MAG: hypothetical protein ACI9J3_002122 [Parvicellaceae bacterium]|jgi:hypothetical protein